MVGYCDATWYVLIVMLCAAPTGAWLIGSYFRRKTRQAWVECDAEIRKASLDMQDDFKENMHQLRGARNNLQAWQENLEQRENNLGHK